MRTAELFDLSHTIAADYLRQYEYPWDAIIGIGKFICEIGPTLDPAEYNHPAETVWIHKTAKVFDSAIISGPVIIGPNSHVFHCAVVRNGALIGADCTVGSAVEIKNLIMFDHVELCHFNYAGDSILGYHAHFGAGAITSNVKSDYSNIIIHGENDIDTHSWKVGAMIGDHAEIGCNAVLNPGTVIGRNSTVYPCSSVRGVIPPSSIFKAPGRIVPKR